MEAWGCERKLSCKNEESSPFPSSNVRFLFLRRSDRSARELKFSFINHHSPPRRSKQVPAVTAIEVSEVRSDLSLSLSHLSSCLPLSLCNYLLSREILVLRSQERRGEFIVSVNKGSLLCGHLWMQMACQRHLCFCFNSSINRFPFEISYVGSVLILNFDSSFQSWEVFVLVIFLIKLFSVAL